MTRVANDDSRTQWAFSARGRAVLARVSKCRCVRPAMNTHASHDVWRARSTHANRNVHTPQDRKAPLFGRWTSASGNELATNWQRAACELPASWQRAGGPGGRCSEPWHPEPSETAANTGRARSRMRSSSPPAFRKAGRPEIGRGGAVCLCRRPRDSQSVALVALRLPSIRLSLRLLRRLRRPRPISRTSPELAPQMDPCHA